jgi:hypothetical protein
MIGLPAVSASSRGTLYFDQPVQLEAGGVPSDLGSHAVTRLADWNSDGDADLLVGGGDGYVWLFLNVGTPTNAVFEAGQKIYAGSSAIRAGTGYTTACFKDMTGDNLPDLLIAYGDRVRVYPNTGTATNPTFNSYMHLQGPSGEHFLTATSYGRIDAADWDDDGLIDIWSGDFNGSITFFRNDGTTNSPHFAAGELYYSHAYNAHPTVFDINQDGRNDLLYGINWGYIGAYINDGEPGQPHFRSHLTLRHTDGTQIDIRSINGDDTTPTFAELNGDGIIDLVSGGKNGKLWVMFGVSYTTTLARIEQIMQAHPSDLGTALQNDTALRSEIFDLHQGMRTYIYDFLIAAELQKPLFDWYALHVTDYSQYFHKQHLHTTIHPYVPWLAGQVWVNLYESQPDSYAHRTNVAAIADFQGRYRDILVDHGVLFIENSKASTEQQRVVHEYLASIPPAAWDVERITIREFLGPYDGGVGITARSGVNIFSLAVGYPENSFPPDSPAGYIDVYSVALAHEINHNSLDTVGRREWPLLFERKFELLDQASGSDVRFKSPASGGVDWTATKSVFRNRGYWDGNDATWNQAWDDYWATGPGAGKKEYWLRNNLKYCVEAPQESFATLANQYFTDSELMFNLCTSRWARGNRHCINQFILFADYYCLGGSNVLFYTINTQGIISTNNVVVSRNENGHITSLAYDEVIYEFDVDEEGNVTGITGPINRYPALRLSQDVGATDITSTSATLNAVLEYAETNMTEVCIYWGITNGGTSPAAWDGVIDLGTHEPGPVSASVTGLVPATQYYYRTWGTNAAGGAWADNSACFPTPSTGTEGFYTMDITCSGYAGESILSNFPVLVVLNENRQGFAYTQFASAYGDDLRFADAAGSNVPHEIDTWDFNGDSYVWVRIPRLMGASTFIQAFWGDSADGTSMDSTDGNVWIGSYAGVWHMNRTNAVNAVNNSAGRSQGNMSVEGYIGTGQSFSRSSGNQYIDVGDIDVTDLTMEAWTRNTWSNPPGDKTVLYKQDSFEWYQCGTDSNLNFDITGSSVYSFRRGGIPGHEEPAWTCFALTYDSAAGIGKGYLDGIEQYSITNVSGGMLPNQNDHHLTISRMDAQGYYGRLDEVRISSVVRSPDWLHASWHSQAVPDEFANYSPVEWIPEPGGTILWLGLLLLTRKLNRTY